MKQWPKNGDTVNAEELLLPLAKILRKAYKIKPGADLGFDYKGHRVFGHVRQPKDIFSKESLARDLEYQGRDLIDQALVTALQYGIEQGLRINNRTTVGIITMLEASVECAKNLLPNSTEK